ncbi:MAG: hypothetical protein ACI4JS_09405 [Oscillospiraceae bacterium]
MPYSIKEIYEKLDRIERESRIQRRQEREKKKKESQRRYYIVGELFCKYFPDVNDLKPGTKSENEIEFQALDRFLSQLSGEPEQEVFRQIIKDCRGSQNRVTNTECVSGQTEGKEEIRDG